jgi:glycosyltransferase involved in cell wall biosynthesis
MSIERTAVFVVNLVQDVNILRPLVYMATRDFGFKALVLTSAPFQGRDMYGIWHAELKQLCNETGARQESFENEWQALRHLTESGVIFAASESNLPAHATTHNIFRSAPASYLKVTLQHGFECIGFRHSLDHVKAHGPTASFGADIVCGWYGSDSMLSMAPSQKGKLLATGSTALLQQPGAPFYRSANASGLVCENLHSVRLNVSGNFKAEFVDAFGEFCQLLAADKQDVVLRPHPGGQYVLKNKFELPGNARINNAPMYRLDLRQFAYGISAPSSVLIDMMLADIPTAVWVDREGGMDTDAYAGITAVSTPGEWFEFSRAAAAEPMAFVDLQRRFLAAQGMLLDPQDVFMRFAAIFHAVRQMDIRPPGSVVERDRILFIANAHVPTLQLSFEKPLAQLIERGEIVTRLLTEKTVGAATGIAGDPAAQKLWIDDYLNRFDPALLVFCRYSGPASGAIVDWARRNAVPVLYHIDDDLLAIPPDIGETKFAMHNAPQRLETVRCLLGQADLVYASTEQLRERLLGYFPDITVRPGVIYCSCSVMRRPVLRSARKVGYMASADHAHNLNMVLPAIELLLERNPHVGFEFFGSIPIPEALRRFGDRITTAPPIANYGAFLQEFAKLEWDVGICPLAPIDFNLMKANTKWVEYTAVGAAVVASKGTVYDECCADGCGILAETVDGWLDALELLVSDDTARIAQIERAQSKLERHYSISQLRNQVIEVFNECRSVASLVADRQTSEQEPSFV